MSLLNNQSLNTSAVLTEIRPWGKFEILVDSDYCKVKRITVNPDSRLSYQYHYKRSETWVITKGVMTVVLDDMVYDLVYGDSIDIPKESKHRAWNKSNEVCQFIEVQTGTYFGEDDIVRINDDYNRE